MQGRGCCKCVCCFRRLIRPRMESQEMKKTEKSMESLEFVDLTSESSRPSTSKDFQFDVGVNPAFQGESDSMEVIVPAPLPLSLPLPLQDSLDEPKSERSQLFGKAMVAAMTGQKEELEILLKSEPWLLNATDDSGRTLLMFACLCDRAPVARWLLRKGTRADTRDGLDRTAMHWAAQKGSHRSLDLLLGWGAGRGRSGGSSLAETNGCFTGDTEGITPLHFAARLSGSKSLQVMLKRIDLSRSKADLASLSDNRSRSPLHWAAAAGRTENLRILLEHPKGLFVFFEDSGGVRCGQEALMDNEFRTPLHWAARLGHTHIAEWLINKGATPTARDKWGATPLHYAAQNNWKNVIQVIIETGGLKEDLCDSDWRSSLMWGGVAGAWESVAKILNLLHCERGQRDGAGATALHLVARAGKTRVAELLLDRGWNANAEDCRGQTPVFYAVERGQTEMVGLLLKKTNSPQHRDKDGRSLLHWAALGEPWALYFTHMGSDKKDFRDAGIFRLWLDDSHLLAYSHPMPSETPFCLLALIFHYIDTLDLEDMLGMKYIRLVPMPQQPAGTHPAWENFRLRLPKLLSAFIKPFENRFQDKCRHSGEAVRHWVHQQCIRAYKAGDGYMVSRLLKEQKMDPDWVDGGGRSPMHCAAFSGHIASVSLLLQAGGDPTLPDHSGLTPLHLAAWENRLEVAAFLLQWECFVNALGTFPAPNNNNLPAEKTPASTSAILVGKEGEEEALEPEEEALEEEEKVEEELELVTPLDLAIKENHQDMQLLLLDEGGLSYRVLVTVAATKIQACYRGFRMRRIMDGVREGDVSLEIRSVGEGGQH